MGSPNCPDADDNGRSSMPGTGVPPSVVRLGPFNPAETVPHDEGGIPGRGVIVQQVTRLRTAMKPPTASASVTTQKMICPTDGIVIFIFFRKFILSIYLRAFR